MSLARAEILMRTRRYADAEAALHESLRNDPEEARAHLLLAQVHLQQQQKDGARREIGEAIRLDPEDPVAFLVLAAVERAEGRDEAAVEAAHEARRLAPGWAEPLNVLAQREAGRERWAEALGHAEEALRLDPENQTASGLRAFALTHLGRREEAADAAARGLQNDPHDPDAHTVRGYTLLHRGEAKEAQAAFLEALRLEPGHEGAASGLVLALKRRSWLLRPVFAFFFWMQRIPPRFRTGLIIGAWLLFQVLDRVTENMPAVRPFVLPLLIVYIAFCVATWVADPLMNLLLRLHPVGRHALDREHKQSGTRFGLGVLTAGVALGLSFAALPAAGDLRLTAAGFLLAGVFGAWATGMPGDGRRRIVTWCAAFLAVAAPLVWVASAAGVPAVTGLLLLLCAAAAIVAFVTPLTRNLG